jgi:hypothetical protein
LDAAEQAGIVMVGAAGNEGRSDTGSNTFLPGTYPSVIAVAALNDNNGEPFGALGNCGGLATAKDGLASFSNTGSGVDIVAPGTCVLSTLPGGGYGLASGTSMASPGVAGAAALASLEVPAHLSGAARVAAVKAHLLDHMTVPPDSACGYSGADTGPLLLLAACDTTPPPVPPAPVVSSTALTQITVSFPPGNPDDVSPTRYQYRSTSPNVTTWQDVGLLGPALSVTWNIAYDWLYRFEVRAVDSEGNASEASAPLDVLIEYPDLPVPTLTVSAAPSGGVAISWTSTAGRPDAEFVEHLEVNAFDLETSESHDLASFEGADATRAGTIHWDVGPGDYFISLAVWDGARVAVGTAYSSVSVTPPDPTDEDTPRPPGDEPPPTAPEEDIPPPPEDGSEAGFGDVPATHTFSEDIAWLHRSGITRGCSGDRFCPDQSVTRGQMAAFLRRALGPDLDMTRPSPAFTDVGGSPFAADIDWLYRTGVASGCDTDRFCPDDLLTREQMAAFLHRALDSRVPALGPEPAFTDTDDSVFVTDIEWLARAGVTRGCNPPENSSFCPTETLTRAQMAAFLRRALAD